MNNYYHAGYVCYISTLVVDTTCRGKHIGTDLIDRVKLFAIQKNCNAIELDANFHRQQTHVFYENYGFMKRGFTFTKGVAN
ncbi:GNAT family N-acetyltransferase [Lacrimispora brassicae]